MLPNRNDWENPQLSAVNRLPSHASGLPFADEDSALSRDAQRTPYHALPLPRPQYLSDSSHPPV